MLSFWTLNKTLFWFCCYATLYAESTENYDSGSILKHKQYHTFCKWSLLLIFCTLRHIISFSLDLVPLPVVSCYHIIIRTPYLNTQNTSCLEKDHYSKSFVLEVTYFFLHFLHRRMARIPNKIHDINGSKETLKLAVRITDLWFVGTPDKSEQAEMIIVDSNVSLLFFNC